MPESFKNDILKETISIADKLIENAINDDNGIYWKSLEYVDDHTIDYKISATIYSGNAGILLFFIELYHLTGDEKYRSLIEKSCNWIIHYCKNNPSPSSSFYTGRLGVGYVLIECYKIFKDEKIKDAALEISISSFNENEVELDDIFVGHAGILLGLMMLYNYFDTSWVLEKMDRSVENIIRSAHFSLDEGISWSRNSHTIKNLCGFSHGVSGIAFVLFELSQFLNNDAFSWMARQAIIYENNQFNQKYNEWPDFRTDNRKEEMNPDIELFEKGEYNYEYIKRGMNYWCNGATGIGLSRLRSFELFQQTSDLKDLNKSIEIHRSKNKNVKASFTLCHGLGADAIFYLDLYNSLGHEDYRTYSQEITKQSLEFSQIHKHYKSGLPTDNQDYSLFLGLAGIGYAYLKQLRNSITTNILAPIPASGNVKMLNTKFRFLSLKKEDLISLILKTNFGETLLGIETIKKSKYHFTQPDDSTFLASLQSFLKKEIEGNPILIKRFEFENEKSSLKNYNKYYFTIQEIVYIKRLNKFNASSSDITKINFILHPFIQIYQIQKYPWEIEMSTEEDFYFMLMPEPYSIRSVKISHFCFLLFDLAKKQTSFKKIYESLLTIYTIPEDDVSFQNYLKDQLLCSIKDKILVLLD